MFLTAPGVRQNRPQVKPGRAVSELSTALPVVATHPRAHRISTKSSTSPQQPAPKTAASRPHQVVLQTACPSKHPPNAPTAQGSSGYEPKRALEAITQPHRAQRESPTSPRASSARVGSLPRSHPSDPPTPSNLSPHPNSLSLEPQQPVPGAPPASIWRAQHNAGFLDARERVRFPQSFGTNPEHVHEQHR